MILEASKAKKTFSGLLPVQSVRAQYICIEVLQRKGEWMSFLSELMPMIESYCSVGKTVDVR